MATPRIRAEAIVDLALPNSPWLHGRR